MEMTALMQLKDLGLAAAISLAAVGSALGSGAAGMAAVGAWKKCYAQSKAAPRQRSAQFSQHSVRKLCKQIG